MGHISMRHDDCFMKGKSLEIQKAAKDKIQKDLLVEQMELDSDSSSKYC